jgi:hypothetical protein
MLKRTLLKALASAVITATMVSPVIAHESCRFSMATLA